MIRIPGIDDDWVTTTEGARLSGYSQAYMRQLAQRGVIPARKVGRDWLLEREALLRFALEMKRLGTAKHSPKRKRLSTTGGKPVEIHSLGGTNDGND